MTVSVTFVFADGQALTARAEVGQSLMEAAAVAEVSGILSDCGGGAICGMCHVYVDPAWTSRVGSPKESEEDTLDGLWAPCPTSRLACQIVLKEELDGLIVRIPQRARSASPGPGATR